MIPIAVYGSVMVKQEAVTMPSICLTATAQMDVLTRALVQFLPLPTLSFAIRKQDQHSKSNAPS
jgi:hypothetical protein